MRVPPTSLSMRASASLAALASVALLAGCGLGKTNAGGWISGNGQVQQYAAADRGAPIELTGTTLTGSSLDLSSLRGKPTVVNVWGAWCGDCIAEADDLQKAHEQLGRQANFVGIDIRDSSVDQARAFERGHAITYPSVYSPDGTAVLAFSDTVSPQTIPATLVLDAQGRVAAVIRGTLPSTLTLVEVVQDVVGIAAGSGPSTGSGNGGSGPSTGSGNGAGSAS